MSRKLCLTIICILGLSTRQSIAYEPDTHRELSKSSALQSSLAAATNNVLTNFGLSSDITSASQQGFPGSRGTSRSIVELIQDGADFEDNFPRSIQHFYDPINDKALQHPTVSAFTYKSPDWALEDTGQISGQNYSYTDAMNAFYDALTLPTKNERDAKWGQVFETLGHVIHHIQDMAQPQHVRNDLHCDAFVPCGFPGGFIGLYDKSLFESRSRKVFKAGIPTALTGYPAVTFPTAREFWTTRATDAVAIRRGMADFTNRNFVSKDTNFEIKNGVPSVSSLYNLPVPSGSNTQTLAALLPNNNQGSDLCQQLNQVGPIDLPPNSPCDIEFIENIVTDSYAPSSTPNQRAASLSLFDQYLAKYNVKDLFVDDGDNVHMMDVNRLPTINRFNIDAAHQFLIPRAIAYSAGLIDHCFRGKIDMIENIVIPGTYFVQNLSSEDMNGVFDLYYDGEDNLRHPVPNASWAMQIPTGGQSPSISFTAPTNPPPRIAGQYILVFNGSMGAEIANGGPGTVTGRQIVLQYWEPWGDTLRENHDWDVLFFPIESLGYGTPPPEPVPSNGVLSLDTRAWLERGASFCNTYFPGLDPQFCDGPTTEIHLAVSRIASPTSLIVRLKADSFHGSFYGECSLGTMVVVDPAAEDQPAIDLDIYHRPTGQNSVFMEPTTDPNRVQGYLVNNGEYAEYTIPLTSLQAIDYISIGSADFRETIQFDCTNAYFDLEIDYIHFY